MLIAFYLLACSQDPAAAQSDAQSENITRKYETCTYISSMPAASWDVCPTINEGHARMKFMHPRVASDYPSCKGFYTWPWLAPPADGSEMSWRLYCATTILDIGKSGG